MAKIIKGKYLKKDGILKQNMKYNKNEEIPKINYGRDT